MKLVAEILTGTLFYVEVEEDATVRDLKRKIENQENLPSDRLILILDTERQQRILMDKDQVPLKFYGARDWSRIYLFFRPLGDVPAQYSTSNAPSPSGNVSHGHPNEPSPPVDPSDRHHG
ncbi:hypothetical protein OROGR_032875 [Orobanche gracilis]